MIDKSFDNIKLDSIQHENIRLGIMDKLLKDPEIQKLFDMKIGVVDILNSVAKGQKTEILKVDEANSQMEVILRTIADRINVANQPLLKLMKDKGNTLPVTLLSNPEEIAKYNGGEVSNDIQAMSEINKK
ncbi:hypothetical protein CO024_02555 [Candidatus Gracilibacteria bacterium CG_4_9_14_0_2_um_filter_38_7]|nr:MAG: hypothetical protein CO024_02555 [Candidatus Gracilibacteria bacterium CG_4_9_14_0_2_um_filter_38_7]